MYLFDTPRFFPRKPITARTVFGDDSATTTTLQYVLFVYNGALPRESATFLCTVVKLAFGVIIGARLGRVDFQS